MLAILLVHRQKAVLGWAGVMSSAVRYGAAGLGAGTAALRRQRDAGGLNWALPSPTTFPRAASLQLGPCRVCSDAPSPLASPPTPLSDNIRGRSVIFAYIYIYIFFLIVVISFWWWDLQAQGGSSLQTGRRTCDNGARRSAIGTAVIIHRCSPQPGLCSLFVGLSHFFEIVNLQHRSKLQAGIFKAVWRGACV